MRGDGGGGHGRALGRRCAGGGATAEAVEGRAGDEAGGRGRTAPEAGRWAGRGREGRRGEAGRWARRGAEKVCGRGAEPARGRLAGARRGFIRLPSTACYGILDIRRKHAAGLASWRRGGRGTPLARGRDGARGLALPPWFPAQIFPQKGGDYVRSDPGRYDRRAL